MGRNTLEASEATGLNLAVETEEGNSVWQIQILPSEADRAEVQNAGQGIPEEIVKALLIGDPQRMTTEQITELTAQVASTQVRTVREWFDNGGEPFRIIMQLRDVDQWITEDDVKQPTTKELRHRVLRISTVISYGQGGPASLELRKDQRKAWE